MELEKLETESNSSLHLSNVLIQGHENEEGIVMEIDNAYTDKLVCIFHVLFIQISSEFSFTDLKNDACPYRLALA